MIVDEIKVNHWRDTTGTDQGKANMERVVRLLKNLEYLEYISFYTIATMMSDYAAHGDPLYDPIIKQAFEAEYNLWLQPDES